MNFKIEIFEYGEWFPVTEPEKTFERALKAASGLCRSFRDDCVRIICPDGRIL